MKKAMLLVAVLFVFASVSAFAGGASVKVINQSKWEIHHIYLSPSGDDDWGPDQLEDEILKKGDSLTLTDIACDTYDVKVVDEDGDECVIEEADLCKDHSYWKITDAELLKCEGYE
jgi:hypothetical protein